MHTYLYITLFSFLFLASWAWKATRLQRPNSNSQRPITFTTSFSTLTLLKSDCIFISYIQTWFYFSPVIYPCSNSIVFNLTVLCRRCVGTGGAELQGGSEDPPACHSGGGAGCSGRVVPAPPGWGEQSVHWTPGGHLLGASHLPCPLHQGYDRQQTYMEEQYFTLIFTGLISICYSVSRTISFKILVTLACSE